MAMALIPEPQPLATQAGESRLRGAGVGQPSSCRTPGWWVAVLHRAQRLLACRS